jgi:hypothetical protein
MSQTERVVVWTIIIACAALLFGELGVGGFAGSSDSGTTEVIVIHDTAIAQIPIPSVINPTSTSSSLSTAIAPSPTETPIPATDTPLPSPTVAATARPHRVDSEEAAQTALTRAHVVTRASDAYCAFQQQLTYAGEVILSREGYMCVPAPGAAFVDSHGVVGMPYVGIIAADGQFIYPPQSIYVTPAAPSPTPVSNANGIGW